MVDFPPKASITPEKAAKLAKIFSIMETEKPSVSKKAERKILEEYDEEDLNEDPSGGKIKEEQGHRGGAQQVRCESQ